MNLSQESPHRQSVRFNLNQPHLRSSILIKSHRISKNYKFVKYNQTGHTQLVQQPQQIQQGYSYRKVHLQQSSQDVLGKNIDWQKDMAELGSQLKGQRKVVMRSLRKLYEKNFRPEFFGFGQQVKALSFKYFDKGMPGFFYQMDHLSPGHVRSLFLTQTYSQTGLYTLALNHNGRFTLITITDQLPVYSDTNEHIWNVQNPWQMLLCKAWACVNGGYAKIQQNYRPFQFMEHFSSNNWRYYNLQRDGIRWVKRFVDVIDVCYIVVQSKDSQQVRKLGIVPNSVAYNITRISNDKLRQQLQIQVKARFKHQWKGKLNLLHYNGKFPQHDQKSFKLQRNFILTKQQFFDMFSCAYVTSLSKTGTHVTDYYEIQVPGNMKNAIYIKFLVKEKGFLDFSFIQAYSNKTSFHSNQSKIDHQNYNKQINRTSSKTRYLRCKYMLIRSMKTSTKPFQSKLLSRTSLRSQQNQPQLTSTAKFQAYQVQSLSGYNKGQAHFISIEPGEYYFRLKSQATSKPATYYLNYCSSQKLQLSQQLLSDEEKEEIFHNCILSLLPAAQRYKTKVAVVYSGDTFGEMGYGYVVVQNVAQENNVLLVQVDLEKLREDGYRLKGKKYNVKGNCVGVEVKKGKHVVLVFKRLEGQGSREGRWPSKAIDLFNAKDLQVVK